MKMVLFPVRNLFGFCLMRNENHGSRDNNGRRQRESDCSTDDGDEDLILDERSGDVAFGTDDGEAEVFSEDCDSTDDDDAEVFSEDGDLMENTESTNSTIVPGTDYDVISAASRREAIRRRIPPSSLVGIDNRYERWIRLVMWDDWGIQFPHDWQIRAIHDIAFSRDTSTFLVAKTGSGKSAVPLTVGSLLTGVTLTMVPLVDSHGRDAL